MKGEGVRVCRCKGVRGRGRVIHKTDIRCSAVMGVRLD